MRSVLREEKYILKGRYQERVLVGRRGRCLLAVNCDLVDSQETWIALAVHRETDGPALAV